MAHFSNHAGTPAHPSASVATWAGLFIALFSPIIIRQAIHAFYSPFTLAAPIWGESLMWLSMAVLLFLLMRVEKLPLRAIGLGTSSIKWSLIWGAILAVVLTLVAVGLVVVTHYTGGQAGEAMSKRPLWLVFLIVVRAGVMEEIFYRGYAIERLQAIGLNRSWAATVPLLIFAVSHWTGGWANIVIALALGAILTASYLWRRDLVANMIGHFLIDFVANVLPRL
jgi:uncharacterized protein